MASRTRDARVVASVACPVCRAERGTRCRNPHPHDPARGTVDRRPQPRRPHLERRDAWRAARSLIEDALAPKVGRPLDGTRAEVERRARAAFAALTSPAADEAELEAAAELALAEVEAIIELVARSP